MNNNNIKWISVNDRLPSNLGHLYYLVTDGDITLMSYRVSDKWYILGGFAINTITHWMPLPNPPRNE